MIKRKATHRGRRSANRRGTVSFEPALLSLSIRAALRRPLSLTSALTLSVMLSTGGSEKALAKAPQALKSSVSVEQSNLLDSGLVVIDPSVPYYRQLISGVRQGFQAVVLDAERDGLTQLGEVLRANPGIRSVHLIAHGEPGAFRLGNAWIRREDLEANQTALSTWFAPGPVIPELMLYGCNVAQGDKGQAFVHRLSALTGADVAASNDVTGSRTLGGDWVLEISSGPIESTLAFSPNSLAAYAGVLVTIKVSTPDDVVDFTGAQQINDLPGPDKEISLREAVIAANNTAGSDTIELGNNTYSLTIPGSSDDAAMSGDLDIRPTDIRFPEVTTIRGIAQNETIIDATNLGDRVLHVHGGASLVLERVTVTGGTASFGGGIENAGTATLRNSTVSANTASLVGGGVNNRDSVMIEKSSVTRNSAYLAGGGIFNSEGIATLKNSIVSENSAGRYGGGIYNNTAVTLENSFVLDNNASLEGGGLFNRGTATLNQSTVSGNSALTSGGGIRNYGYDSEAEATLNQSTVSGNNAGNRGGGIINGAYNSTTTLNQSTVSGNSARDGGGIYSEEFSSATLTNSTVSGNSASGQGGGFFIREFATVTLAHSTVSGNSAPVGGGIRNYGDGDFVNYGEATLRRSLIANSTGGSCVGPITDGKLNRADDATCGASLLNTTINLGPLADNGGHTQTHALLAGSSAIDAVPLSECVDVLGKPLAIDQRGVTRAQGPRCDVGAFEADDADGDSIADVNEIAAGRNPLVNEPAVITIINSILLDD